MATESDLLQTVKEVEGVGRRPSRRAATCEIWPNWQGS